VGGVGKKTSTPKSNVEGTSQCGVNASKKKQHQKKKKGWGGGGWRGGGKSKKAGLVAQ